MISWRTKCPLSSLGLPISIFTHLTLDFITHPLVIPAQNSQLPTIARVTEINQGDLAYYLDLVDDNGQKYSGVYALFEICQQPKIFLHKRIGLSYHKESCNDCQNTEPYDRTRQETAITRMTFIAQSNPPKRIQFDRGGTSKTIKNSVVRGTRDIFLLGAKASQKMNIFLTSLEDNAVFNLVIPNNITLKQKVTNASVILPLNGDYKIIVGGTRGNATYESVVEIKNTVKTEILKTKNFKIYIRSNCLEGAVTCDKVFYEGINVRTGDSIKLVGKTLHTTCADGITPCRFLGYEFRNGNYRYVVRNDGLLLVYHEDTLLLEEQGTWQN